MKQSVIVFGVLLIISGSTYGRTVSPNDFGLQQALTAEERYEALYRAHSFACKSGYSVSYKGISSIDLIINPESKPIPLSDNTDFCGVSLNVKNNAKDFFLFNKIADTKQIRVPSSCFSSYDFRGIASLRKRQVVLVVQDNNPWVDNRAGHNYGASRKDILVLRRGKAKNRTVASYDNVYSSPSCQYFVTTTNKKSFKNVTFNRDSSSTYKTFLFKIENIYNLEICGITINTPTNDTMFGDAVMMINNCAYLDFHDVTINGTYSRADMYGYGISMDNVWNSRFDNIMANCDFGVFGNNNIQRASVSNSYINRFDIHCYGKDLFFDNVIFSQMGLSIGSFYGDANFTRCTFTQSVPCACRKDYNAYTPFNLKFSNCVFNLTRRFCYIINMASIPTSINSRAELTQKCLPNVAIENCVFHLSDDMTEWTLFYVGEGAASDHYSFGHIDNISMRNSHIESNQSVFKLFNRTIYSTKDVIVDINGLTNESKRHPLGNGSFKAMRDDNIVVNIRKKNSISDMSSFGEK